MQGAFFYATQIASIKDPHKATVFNVASLTDRSSTLFDETKMGSNDRVDLDAIANYIRDEEARIVYKLRVKRAIDHPTYDAKQVWRPDNSPTRVQEVVTELCQVQARDQPSRLAAAQGFRNNFKRWLYRPVGLQNNSDYQKLILTLDTTLCTLETCKDLRDGIEGLDCTKGTN